MRCVSYSSWHRTKRRCRIQKCCNAQYTRNRSVLTRTGFHDQADLCHPGGVQYQSVAMQQQTLPPKKENSMRPIVSLEGKVGLITGIANEKSISTGVAEACAQAGAKIIITYQTEKTRAFLEPIIQRLG